MYGNLPHFSSGRLGLYRQKTRGFSHKNKELFYLLDALLGSLYGLDFAEYQGFFGLFADSPEIYNASNSAPFTLLYMYLLSPST